MKGGGILSNSKPIIINIPGVKEWTITDLRKCCSKNKVKGYTKMSREELEEEVSRIIKKLGNK